MRMSDWRSVVCSSDVAWTSDAGRVGFCAEGSRGKAGGFDLRFIKRQHLSVEVVEEKAPGRFVFRYFGGSTVTVTLSPDDGHGCDVHLVETGIASADEWVENHAGWVSVLLALKATGDFGVDLQIGRAHVCSSH